LHTMVNGSEPGSGGGTTVGRNTRPRTAGSRVAAPKSGDQGRGLNALQLAVSPQKTSRAVGREPAVAGRMDRSGRLMDDDLKEF